MFVIICCISLIFQELKMLLSFTSVICWSEKMIFFFLKNHPSFWNYIKIMFRLNHYNIIFFHLHRIKLHLIWKKNKRTLSLPQMSLAESGGKKWWNLWEEKATEGKKNQQKQNISVTRNNRVNKKLWKTYGLVECKTLLTLIFARWNVLI